jgi:hypothetical protein
LTQLERTLIAISSTEPSIVTRAENGDVESSQLESSRLGVDQALDDDIGAGPQDNIGKLGTLVRQNDDSASQYVDEVLLSRVLEEVMIDRSTLFTPIPGIANSSFRSGRFNRCSPT